MPENSTGNNKDTQNNKTETANTDKGAKAKKRNIFLRIFRKSPKLFAYGSILIVLLIIFLLIFIQTSWFNSIAKNYVVDLLNQQWSQRESELYVESIEGNIFKGLTLKNGSIRVKQDTLIKFTTAVTDYNIWRLLRNDIYINHVEIFDPQINLTTVRAKNDSLMWNFEYLLVKEEKLVDTTEKFFDWNIFADDIKIHNGNLKIVKDKGEAKTVREYKFTKLDTIDLNNINIYNFYLDASAQYFPNYKYINIRNLSSSTNSDFNLKRLTIEATLDQENNIADVKNLNVVTDKSEIYADHIRLENFNPFSDSLYNEFVNAPLTANINIKKFYFSDLKVWLPVLNFFDSWASVHLIADGKFNDLSIKRVDVSTPNSNMHATGRVIHLDSTEKMWFDIKMFDSQISGGETKVLLPGLPLPDYHQVGMVNANATYRGTIYKFQSDFDVRTGAGGASGVLDMDMRNTPVYSLDVTTYNLDLGKVLVNKDLEGSVNMHAKINGAGFDPKSTNTRVVYEMQNSRIYNQNIASSAGVIDIHGMKFNVDANINASNLQAAVKGSINLVNPKNPSYDMQGQVKGLDVAQFTKNSADKSNINASFDIKGSGASLNNLNGDYRINFANSYYGKYAIPATPLNLKINNSSSNGYLTLNSNIVDVNVRGSFNLALITDVIKANLESIADEIQNKTSGRDTSINLTASSIPRKESRYASGSFNFEYEINVKNPNALAQLLKNEGIFFDGYAKGNVTNSPADFTFNSDFNIKNFRLKDSVVYLNNFTGNVQFSNEYQSPVVYSGLDQLKANINIRGNKLITSGISFDSVKLNYVLNNSIGDITASAIQSEDKKYFINGLTDLTGNRIGLKVDTMFVKYDLFKISNDGRLVVWYEPVDTVQNFRLDTFNLSSNFFKLTGGGVFSLNGQSDLTLEGSKIKVAEVLEFAYPPDTTLYARVYNKQFRSPLRGDIRRLFISYKGDIYNPILSLELNTELLRYENTRVGRIDAFADYADNNLKTDILLSNAQGRGRLRVEGNIPYKNPMIGNTDSLTLINTPVNIVMSSKDFQINFFSKLIPNIGDLRGLMNGQLTTTGTAASPLITGGMNFTNGRFFLPMTGMYNRFSGNLNAENSNLVIDNFKITSGENNTAEMRLGGRINMQGLTVNDIDINAEGSLYLLDKTVDKNNFDLYGVLLISTGNPSFSIKGNLDNIKLAGQFLIKDADVELQSIAQSPYNIYNDNFVYRLITDSNFVMKDTVIYVTKDEYDNIDPFLRTKYYALTEEPTKETNLSYNINIKTTKSASVKFDISKALKQAFYGQIETDLDITNNSGGNMNITGDVNIVGDSYLRFYRNFLVKNSKIRFTGPADNPELDVHATYEVSRAYEDKIAVLLDVTGPADKMNISLKLNQNGNILATEDAQSDAISYILFGVPRGQLSENQKTAIGTIGATTGSSYLSSMFSDAIRTIAPFVTSAEINYSQGNFKEGTSLNLTSQFGSAIVRIGGRLFSGLSNTEVSVEYPLNKLFNINLSNRLLFEFFRIADINAPVTTGTLPFTTGVRVSYKITF